MKIKITVLIILAFIGTALYAQAIDKPAATVRLYKLEVISATQFASKVKSFELQARRPLTKAEKQKLLDTMIGEILISQAAEKEHISVTEAEIRSRLDLAKKTGGVGLRLNRALTDQELKTLVRQSGISWDLYQKEIRKVILEQKYIMIKKRSMFTGIKEPTEQEIQDFYDENKTLFVSPEMVRFQHIFIDTRSLKSSAERKKARERAEEVAQELRNGASFDDLVVKFSDDKASRYSGGDFGYLRRDDAARKQLLGRNFFDSIFKMKPGQISGVLESNIGFHIVRIVKIIPFKVLNLDDKVPPQNKVTVRQQIKSTLYQNKQAEVFQRALYSVINDLKKKAEIKIFEKNIAW